MKQFFRITALSVLLFSSAGLVALTAQECGLSAEDVACLKRADNTRYAWLTPNVCEELSKVCRTVKRSQKRRDIKRVVDYIKKENNKKELMDTEDELPNSIKRRTELHSKRTSKGNLLKRK